MKELTFPGGEVHVQLDDDEMSRYEHRANLWSSDDVMRMLLVNNALQPRVGDITWTIPYVPYARQDRRANEGEPLSIQVMANLINSMGAAEVKIWDPHSDVTPALINNVTIVPQEQLVHRMIGHAHYDAVVAPDAGAAKKALKVAQRIGSTLIQAHKIRDTVTGQITGTRLLDPVNNTMFRILVVDDICDGGRTFVELGRLLRGALPDAGGIDLYVTHGIFSQGLGSLADIYDRIYCPNPRSPDICAVYPDQSKLNFWTVP
jgi:ribose-phosphate pyrophosphokinase